MIWKEIPLLGTPNTNKEVRKNLLYSIFTANKDVANPWMYPTLSKVDNKKIVVTALLYQNPIAYWEVEQAFYRQILLPLEK